MSTKSSGGGITAYTAAGFHAGKGGFGGGAGGAAALSGSTSGQLGGGGLGAGGDIFVRQGATMTNLGASSLGAGSVSGGSAQRGGANDQGSGGSTFLQGDESLSLAPSTGQTRTISGVIADAFASLSGRAR